MDVANGNKTQSVGNMTQSGTEALNHGCHSVPYFKEATLQQTCSTLQHSLHRDNIDKMPAGRWSLKIHVYRRLRKPHCSILQHTATPWHCNVYKLTQMRILFKGSQQIFYLATVQTTTDCNTLQHAATHCNTVRLHHTATYRAQTTTDLIHEHKRALYTLKDRHIHPTSELTQTNTRNWTSPPQTYLYVHPNTLSNTHTLAHTHVHTHTHTHMHTHVHTHTHTHAHTHMHTHTHMPC